MAAVAAGCRKALVNAIVLLSCTNGPRKHSFRLVGAAEVEIQVKKGVTSLNKTSRK